MAVCLIVAAGVAAAGLSQAPADINGAYSSSCGSSYCRGVYVTQGPQASSSSILMKPTGYGYSSKYNYGLQPEWVQGSTWHGSAAYNYGRMR